MEEALGKEIAGNKHYNLLYLTLLYNGEDFSNSCYRMTEVNKKMVKEAIPGFGITYLAYDTTNGTTWNTYSHLYPREEERAVEVLNQIVKK